MAVLHQLPIDVSIDPKDLERVRAEIAKKFWEWYEENLELVLVNKRIAFWKVTLRVRNLYEVFVKLFGHPIFYVPEV